MNFKEMIKILLNFWESQGLDILWPYDVEKGAGTSNPNTFFRVLNDNKEGFAYVEACRRPQDGRYGMNPNRLYQHHQLQVLMKPAPNNIEELYLKSLEALGLDLNSNDIRFIEDNWKQPTLGAWGLGSEVRANGSEITQFTYFQQIANIDLNIMPVEIAYGLERLALVLQCKDDILNLDWDGNRVYGDVFKKREEQFSAYTFDVAKGENYFKLFAIYVEEATRALDERLPIAAYDYVLKASHTYNILDAQKLISEKSRQAYILSVSKLAKKCCQIYMEDR